MIRKTKSQKEQLKIFVSLHSNQILQFFYDLDSKKAEKTEPKLGLTFGELESHKLPIRGV